MKSNNSINSMLNAGLQQVFLTFAVPVLAAEKGREAKPSVILIVTDNQQNGGRTGDLLRIRAV
jgi:hypothetical protein